MSRVSGVSALEEPTLRATGWPPEVGSMLPVEPEQKKYFSYPLEFYVKNIIPKGDIGVLLRSSMIGASSLGFGFGVLGVALEGLRVQSGLCHSFVAQYNNIKIWVPYLGVGHFFREP